MVSWAVSALGVNIHPLTDKALKQKEKAMGCTDKMSCEQAGYILRTWIYIWHNLMPNSCHFQQELLAHFDLHWLSIIKNTFPNVSLLQLPKRYMQHFFQEPNIHYVPFPTWWYYSSQRQIFLFLRAWQIDQFAKLILEKTIFWASSAFLSLLFSLNPCTMLKAQLCCSGKQLGQIRWQKMCYKKIL